MDLATVRRDELREVAAATVLAIVAVSAYGMLAPTSSEVVTLDDSGISGISGSDLGDVAWLLVIFLGAFSVGAIGWALVVERRRPWPLGPRRIENRPREWWTVVPLVGALFASSVLLGFVWPDVDFESRLYAVAGRDDIAMHLVSSPTMWALRLVVWLAALGILTPLAHAAARAWRARRRPYPATEAPAP